MQRCPNCQSQQIDGTMFCSICGASLLTISRQQTKVPLSQQPPVDMQREHTSGAVNEQSETRLSLTVLVNGRKLVSPVQEELLVGRRDDSRGITPDIDLGAEGGYDAGVSRRHAIIIWSDGRYYVEDLGSANGTFVNDERVEAQRRVSLHNGDELRFGMLELRVEISP